MTLKFSVRGENLDYKILACKCVCSGCCQAERGSKQGAGQKENKLGTVRTKVKPLDTNLLTAAMFCNAQQQC